MRGENASNPQRHRKINTYCIGENCESPRKLPPPRCMESPFPPPTPAHQPSHRQARPGLGVPAAPPARQGPGFFLRPGGAGPSDPPRGHSGPGRGGGVRVTHFFGKSKSFRRFAKNGQNPASNGRPTGGGGGPWTHPPHPGHCFRTPMPWVGPTQLAAIFELAGKGGWLSLPHRALGWSWA